MKAIFNQFIRSLQRMTKILLGKDKSSSAESLLIFSGFIFLLIWAYWGLWSVTRLQSMSADSFLTRIGAPLLLWQIIIVLMICFLLWRVSLLPKIRVAIEQNPFLFDAVLFFLIWVAAAWIWCSQPVQPQYSISMPYPPNNEYYPFSDAGLYASGAKKFITGYPTYEELVDKPLFVVYQVFIHLVGGRSGNSVLQLNTIFLSVLPAILFLIGKSIANRLVGIGIAALYIFKQVNILLTASTVYMSSNVQTNLTEFLTGVFVALSALALIFWLKSPRKPLGAILTGGMIGLSTLIRLNPMILLPLGPLLGVLVEKRISRKWLLMTGLYLSSFVITQTPWLIFNQATYNNPLKYIYRKAVVVVVDRRFVPYMIEGKDSIDTILPTPTPPSTLPIPAQNTDSQPATFSKLQFPFKRYASLAMYIVDRFCINIMAGIFVIAPRLSDNLQSMFTHYYWNHFQWHDFGALLSLLCNFTIVSIGMGYSWIRWKWVGLVPFFVNLTYGFGSAVALTAAGFRGIVPVDWTVLVYFAIGIFVVLTVVSRKKINFQPESNPENTAAHLRSKTILALTLFVAIASLPIVITWIFPTRYLPTQAEALAQLSMLKTNNNQLIHELERNVDNLRYSYGLAMHPRYYQKNQGNNTEKLNVFQTKDYTRLGFDFFQYPGIDPATDKYIRVSWVELPMAIPPEYFPNNTEVMIFSCNINGNETPILVALNGEVKKIYQNNLNSIQDCSTGKSSGK